MQQPSTVTSYDDVRRALFPNEEFRATDLVPPPTLWKDALAYGPVAAPNLTAYSMLVPQRLADTDFPVMIVPKNNGNLRRYAVVLAFSANIVLTHFVDGDSVTRPRDSYSLATGFPFYYYGNDALYAYGNANAFVSIFLVEDDSE